MHLVSTVKCPNSLPKLEPGNVVLVRFDGRRTRVFPVTPVQVLPS